MRQKTAECALKIQLAAEAFDYCAGLNGDYPSNQNERNGAPEDIKKVFSLFQMDWWNQKTELGGRWEWYHGADCFSVVISGAHLSERQMTKLDALLDDGNLKTGTFRKFGPRYHYAVRGTI